MPVSHLKRTCPHGEYLHLSGDNPLAIRHSERLVTYIDILTWPKTGSFIAIVRRASSSSRLGGLHRFLLPPPAMPPVRQCLTRGVLDGALSVSYTHLTLPTIY